jgi:hypothetical protein
MWYFQPDDLLCSIDSEYCRESHQTIRDHLLSLQKPPRAPLAGSEDICDKVTQLYEHARYGKKVMILSYIFWGDWLAYCVLNS